MYLQSKIVRGYRRTPLTLTLNPYQMAYANQNLLPILNNGLGVIQYSNLFGNFAENLSFGAVTITANNADCTVIYNVFHNNELREKLLPAGTPILLGGVRTILSIYPLEDIDMGSNFSLTIKQGPQNAGTNNPASVYCGGLTIDNKILFGQVLNGITTQIINPTLTYNLNPANFSLQIRSSSYPTYTNNDNLNNYALLMDYTANPAVPLVAKYAELNKWYKLQNIGSTTLSANKLIFEIVTTGTGQVVAEELPDFDVAINVLQGGA